MNKTTEQRIMLAIVLAGVTCLLVYTFKHTGGLLARYVDPWGIGYIAAFGIESTIVGMSYRLSTLKRGHSKSRFLTFVLVIALVVSSMANIAEGYRAHYGEALSLANVLKIDPIQAIVWLSATFLMSLLVYALSEMSGDEVNDVIKATKKVVRQLPVTENVISDAKNVTHLDKARQAKDSQIADRRQTVARLLSEGMTPADIAGQTGVHERTIKRDIAALNNGGITR